MGDLKGKEKKVEACSVLADIVGKRQLGGQNVSCDFLWGGERTKERTVQNQFWRPQEVGLVWSVPISCKENERA